jgi:hypothetical protein
LDRNLPGRRRKVKGTSTPSLREAGMGTRGEIFSSKANTAKRTYFFNVKENRTGDVFLNIVESKKSGDDQFERRSVIVFKEDLATFLEGFDAAVRFIKGQ